MQPRKIKGFWRDMRSLGMLCRRGLRQWHTIGQVGEAEVCSRHIDQVCLFSIRQIHDTSCGAEDRPCEYSIQGYAQDIVGVVDHTVGLDDERFFRQ